MHFASHIATLLAYANGRCAPAAPTSYTETSACVLQGMHNDLRAPALLGLAALAAAGQADGVAAEVLHGPNFIGQNQIREPSAVHSTETSMQLQPPCRGTDCDAWLKSRNSMRPTGRPGCSRVYSGCTPVQLIHRLRSECAAAWHPVRALGCGTAVVAATASLIRELAVRGSPDLVNALLQHGSATLLAHVLAQPLAVAWAGPGNVGTLQHRALVSF